MLKKFFLLLSIALVFTGCAGDAFPKGINTSSTTPVLFTVKNYDSSLAEHTYAYTHHPERIVALWQNSIETLIALGAADKIIAVAGIIDERHLKPEFLEAYRKIPLHSRYAYSQESMLLLKPDFILGWYYDFTGKGKTVGLTQFWEDRHVNIYMTLMNNAEYKAKHTLEDEITYIKDVAKIVDKEKTAEGYIADMHASIDRSRQRLAGKRPPKVLIMSSPGKTISIYTPRTLPGDLITKLGGDVCGKDREAVGQNEFIGYEDILMLDPDVIFLQVYPEREQLTLDKLYQHPALQHLRCLKNKQVYTMPFYTVRCPGIRVMEAIDIFARGLENCTAQHTAPAEVSQ